VALPVQWQRLSLHWHWRPGRYPPASEVPPVSRGRERTHHDTGTCQYARLRLLQVAAVMRPLRVAAETARAATRAPVLLPGVLDDEGIAQQRRLWYRQMAALARLPTRLANCRFGGCGGVRLPRPATMYSCASARLTGLLIVNRSPVFH
jgi:hypothetical protein